MAGTVCYTSASLAYLDRVKVLARTLKRFHPDWKFVLCLSDEEPEGFSVDVHRENIDDIVRISALDIDRLHSWIFEHDVVELCTAIKGMMLCRLLDEGAERVFYIDPDIAIFSPLEEAECALGTHDIVLTPHLLDPEEVRSAILDNEVSALKHGIYNLGFIAVSNTSEGRRFANWWRDRLLDFCFDEVERGIFTDQKWCDHVPAFFGGAYILRHQGYNVASWNLGKRPLNFENGGRLRAGRGDLRFFHFTKVNAVGEAMLERYAGDRVEVFELISWYRNELRLSDVKGIEPGWWAYGRFSDGSFIERRLRRAYRDRKHLHDEYPNPFSLSQSETSEFIAALTS